MSNLNDLAARVEALTGPDREVDVRIHWREWGPFPDDLTVSSDIGQTSCEWGAKRYARSGFVPSYTASIDAAMTLVPEGCTWGAGDCGETDGPWATVTSGDFDLGCPDFTANAATPALALTAAALRSRVQGEG